MAAAGLAWRGRTSPVLTVTRLRTFSQGEVVNHEVTPPTTCTCSSLGPAEMVGGARLSVNQVLERLEAQGIVEPDGGRITVADGQAIDGKVG